MLSYSIVLGILCSSVSSYITCTPTNRVNVTSYQGIRYADFNGRFKEATLNNAQQVSAFGYGKICPQAATNVFALLDQDCIEVEEDEAKA